MLDMKIKKMLMCLLCFVSCVAVYADVIFEKSFDNKKINDKLELKKCEIKSDTKYKLDIKVKGSGELKLYFYDKDGNIPLYGIKHYKVSPQKGNVIEFYSPGTSAGLKIVFLNSQKRKLILESIKLETSYSNTLNLNPDFSNNSGHDENVNCAFIKVDGKNLLKINNTNYSMAISNFIPVKSREKLKVFLRRPNTQKKTIKGTVHYCTDNINVNFYYYDKNYRKIDKIGWYVFYSNWNNERKRLYIKGINVPVDAKYLKYIISFYSKKVSNINVSKVSITR
jgi:hypothetical protein